MKHVETPNEFSKEYWRDMFEIQFRIHPTFKRKELSEIDDYFLSAISKDDITHVKKREAGIEKTRRVALALEKVNAQRKKSKKSVETILRRQKLMPSAQ